MPGYLRYVDNLTCFGDSRAQLLAWGEAIGHWLEKERGLKLKPRRDALRSCQSKILYLGYEVSRWGHRPGPQAAWRLRRRLVRQLRLRTDAPWRERVRRSLEATRALACF